MNKPESGVGVIDRVGKTVEQPIEEEIEELREPIRDLLKQLHEHIDDGSYRLLIGGDASGRIPTLIFNKVIKKIYKERGFDVPRTMSAFIAGGKRNGDPIDEKIKKISTHIGEHYVGDNLKSRDNAVLDKLKMMFDGFNEVKYDGRVLIVEDTIQSGASIQPVTDALKSMGIEFDIATIGFLPTSKDYIEERLGAEIFHAIENTPKIYGRKKLSGVSKKRGDLFSKPMMSDESIKARADSSKIADELAKWYLSNF